MSEFVPTRDGWTWSGEDVAAAGSALTLTILYHPDTERIGQTAVHDSAAHSPLALSRLCPLFSFDGEEPAPLDDPYCSRRPLYLELSGGNLTIQASHPRIRYMIDGAMGSGAERLPASNLADGMVLQLGRRILLELHIAHVEPQPRRWHGLVCAGPSMAAFRSAVERMAASQRCALLMGASGTGKEKVAEAIHQCSDRSKAPYVAINMAALPPTTAAAQLFGHARGAFTGAGASAPGYFEKAGAGTLLLDEIGETPPDIQPLLLRALENNEIQPIGGAPRPHRARLLAATDGDLQGMVAEGTFRRALWYRLATDPFKLPPLSARKGDLALQTVTFLKEALHERGASHLLSPPGEGARPWMGLDFMLHTLDAPWHGNSRELKAAMRQVVARCVNAPLATLAESTHPPHPPSVATHRSPDSPHTDDEIEQALQACDYAVRAAARSLGVAPNTLYLAMRRLGIPQAGELTEGDITAAMATVGDQSDEVARHLRVSRMGLLRRMKTLGLR